MDVAGIAPSLVFLIVVALAFDFLNGLHDAANSIATIVSTRVLAPQWAVFWAAFFNFVAAFTFGTAVASTVGKGMIDINVVTFAVVFGGLTGAILWDLFTWFVGLPTSSSHACATRWRRRSSGSSTNSTLGSIRPPNSSCRAATRWRPGSISAGPPCDAPSAGPCRPPCASAPTHADGAAPATGAAAAGAATSLPHAAATAAGEAAADAVGWCSTGGGWAHLWTVTGRPTAWACVQCSESERFGCCHKQGRG